MRRMKYHILVIKEKVRYYCTNEGKVVS